MYVQRCCFAFVSDALGVAALLFVGWEGAFAFAGGAGRGASAARECARTGTAMSEMQEQLLGVSGTGRALCSSRPDG